MTYQAPSRPALHGPAPGRPDPGRPDPGQQVASLREALLLVRAIAGADEAPDDAALLEEAAQVADAYHRAVPVAQRRFDALADEIAAWSAAGVEALLAAGGTPPPAPARRLADELEVGLARLKGVLRSC